MFICYFSQEVEEQMREENLAVKKEVIHLVGARNNLM